MPKLFHALCNRRLLSILVFGFASGLPLALTGQSMQAWLTVGGVDITTIGIFSLVGQPYTYKFLWAPLMDRFEPPFFGRRRGWLVLCQIALALAVLAMARVDPVRHTLLFAAMAALVALFSASQDVVVDAYRTEVASQEESGLAAAVGVFGYRLAMLVSGGLAFLLAQYTFGWDGTYQLMADLLLLCALYTCFSAAVIDGAAIERSRDFGRFAALLLATVLAFAVSWWLLTMLDSGWRLLAATLAASLTIAVVGRLLAFAERQDLLGFAWMAVGVESGYQLGRGLVWLLGVHATARGNGWGDLLILLLEIGCAVPMALLAARLARFRLLLEPLAAYFRMEQAWAFLGLVVLYKLSDAFAGTLVTNFLLNGVHFELVEVGIANKVMGLFATVAGALLGGWLMIRLSLWAALFYFGAVQALANLGYWWLAVAGKGAWGSLALGTGWMQVFLGGKPAAVASAHIDILLLAAVWIENLTSGMGTAALVALLMAMCSDRRATATQYALLSALAALGRVYVGPSSGFLQQALGWDHYFLFAMSMGLPALGVLIWLKPAIATLAGRGGQKE